MAPRLSLTPSNQPNMRRSHSNSQTQTPKSNPLTRRNSSGKSVPELLNSLFSPKASRSDPLFSFGLVADIQYALKDTQIKTCQGGPNGAKLDRRMGWSEGLAKVSQAVKTWNDDNSLDFIMSLGDIIEGNESYMQHLSERELKSVLSVLKESHVPVKHILGNHCRRLCKVKLLPLLGLDINADTYYSFQPAEGWRFICLDTTDICGGAIESDKKDRKLIENAVSIYERPDHWFHGMVSAAQMEWLADMLATACANGESVIMATHYPLMGARTTHLALNSLDILRTIEESGADVVAVFAGHDHTGASVMPETKINPTGTAHITVPGMVESPADSNAFATVSVYEDGSMEIAGYGTVPTHRIRRTYRRRRNVN